MTLLLELVPVQVFATDPDEQFQPQEQAEELNPWTEPVESAEMQEKQILPAEDLLKYQGDTAEADVLYEDTELREEDVKQFRMSDGSYLAVRYGEPVHFEDEEGEWQEIDNRLRLTADVMQHTQVYQTTAGTYTASYARSIQDDFLFGLENDRFRAAFSLVTQPGDATHPYDPDQVEKEDHSPEPEQEQQQEPKTVPQVDSTQPEDAPSENSQSIPQSDEAQAGSQNETPQEKPQDEAVSSVPKEETPQAGESAEAPVTSTEGSASEESTTTEQAQPEPPQTEQVQPDELPQTEQMQPDELPQTEQEQPKNLAKQGMTELSDDVPAKIAARKIIAEPEQQINAIAFPEETLEAQIYPKNLTSALVYRNVFPGIDLRYENCTNGVKESILVNSFQDNYVYTFRLNLENLHPVQQEDGSILLVDENQTEKYYIPAPYMVDAEGNESEAVSYTLTSENDEAYLLTVRADADWISQAVLPVAIDPTIIQLTNNNIYATFVRQGAPDSVYTQRDVLRCGYYNEEKESQIYAYIGTLPTIPSGSVMTDARFGLCQSYTLSGAGSATSLPIKAYEVTSTPSSGSKQAWINDLTWNEKLNYSTVAEDCQTVSNSTNNSFTWWNLTRMTAKWYENSTSNKGFALVVDNAASAGKRVSFRGTNSTTNLKPIFAVTYRSITGLEDYYTYQTQNIGRAGTVSVGDFNHLLNVVRTDVESSSTINPFTLSMVYNSNWACQNFTEVSTAASHIQPYTRYTGGGWKLSAQETCNYIELNNSQYSGYIIYTDADGTEHYFYPTSTSTYVDEDGLGLTITFSKNSSGHNLYSMTDDKGNQQYFYNGYLLYTKDSSGNYIYYCYDGYDYSASTSTWKPTNYNIGHYLSGIFRVNKGGSPQKLVSLTYNTNGYLSTVENLIDGQKTTYYYGLSKGISYLTSVTFADGETVRYEYDNNYRLIAVYNHGSGYGVQYSYNKNNGSVQNIYEFFDTTGSSVRTQQTTEPTNRSYGNRMHAYRASIYETDYRDYGNDHISDNADDIISYYMFDAFGRTICSYSMDSKKEKIHGASIQTYTANTTTNKQNNRVTANAAIGVQQSNLLQNSSLERSDTAADSAYKWISTSTTGNVKALVKSDGPVRTGTRAIKIWRGTQSTTGQFVSCYQQVYLKKDVEYVFSGYVNTSHITTYRAGEGDFLAFTNTSNTVLSASEKIDYNTAGIENGWQRLWVRYTPPTTGYYRLAARQEGSIGYAGFDDLQLEEGSAPSSYNLVQNGSFESSDMSHWVLDGKGSYTASEHLFGSGSLQINASASELKRVRQDVPVNCNPDTTFVVSGWAKATAAPDGVQELKNSTDSYFGIIVSLIYERKGSETTNPSDIYYIPFNSFCTQWQYKSGVIVPKKNDHKILTVSVYLAYDRNINTAYFDGISLTQEPVQTYTYNSNGDLTAVNATKNNPQTATYSGADLTKLVAGGNGTYTFTYDSAHRMTSAVNGTLTQTVNYTNEGNVSSTSLGKTGDTTGAKLKQFYNYDTTKNYVTAESGATAVKNSYTYTVDKMFNSKTGTLAQTDYRYILNSDKISNIYQSGLISIKYGYSGDLLNSMSRKSFLNGSTKWQTYKFKHDSYGNTTGVYVSSSDADHATTVSSTDKCLASYTYETANHLPNGNLRRLTYGNGAYVEYTYDTLGRVVTETYYTSSGVFVVKYVNVYAGDGDLVRQYAVDKNNNELYADDYEYDGLGRLIRSHRTEAGKSVQRTEHLYDKDNRITSQSWQMGSGPMYKQTYTYRSTDGALSALSNFRGGTQVDKLTYTYDSINRLSGRANCAYNETYSYKTASSDTKRATTLVSQINYTAPSTNGKLTALRFNYTYDDNGNITQISKNGSVIGRYTYDSQGQLIQEQDCYGSTADTYTYTYDTAGNIQTVDLAGLGRITTLQYSNGQWQDLLTAVNGKTITYDAIGNPTSYYNGTTMTWTQGRRLASATKGGTTTTYSYDAAGNRTSKKIGNTTYKYTTQNGKVARQEWSGNVLDITYDGNGQPYSCTYTPSGKTATTYYYLLDAQGNVVRLVDASGNSVAEYTYDAWGHYTSTGSMASINPLRYRGYYFDAETGFYYVGSRYYDPNICRFINADGYLSTSQGLLGNNMFAYCGNDPVNRADPSGMFWKEIGDWFKNTWNSIKTWAGNTFGAGSSTSVTITKAEVKYLPDPLPITAKTGTKTTKTVSKHGNSSKPVSVYAKRDAAHPIKSSSAGLKISISNFTLNISLGLDDIGISGSLANGNTTNSFGLRANLSELKVGFEGSSAIQWDDTTETTYTNVSVSGWVIAAAYVFVTTGRPMSSPSYAY